MYILLVSIRLICYRTKKETKKELQILFIGGGLSSHFQCPINTTHHILWETIINPSILPAPQTLCIARKEQLQQRQLSHHIKKQYQSLQAKHPSSKLKNHSICATTMRLHRQCPHQLAYKKTLPHVRVISDKIMTADDLHIAWFFLSEHRLHNMDICLLAQLNLVINLFLSPMTNLASNSWEHWWLMCPKS